MRRLMILLALLPFAATAQRTDDIIFWTCKAPACVPHWTMIVKEPVERVILTSEDITICPSDCVWTIEEVRWINYPYTEIANLIDLCPAVYQRQKGAAVAFKGGRPGEVLYVIDEMRVMPW